MSNPMDSFFTYQNFVLDRVQLKEPYVTGNAFDDATVLAYTGLAGEAGEVADWHKKNLFHKRKLPKEDLLLEMGDVLWYFVLMLHQHGFTLEQVMKANMLKLQERDRQRQHEEAMNAADTRATPFQPKTLTLKEIDAMLAKIDAENTRKIAEAFDGLTVPSVDELEAEAIRREELESRATPFPKKSTMDIIEDALRERERLDDVTRVEKNPQPAMPFVPPSLDTMAGEQVQVSATGGLRFNVGKNRMDLIPPEWTWALGDVLTKGALKYESRNWEKGLGWSDMVGCAMRHVTKFQAGERYDGSGYDKEKGTTGCHHLAMAAWNLLSLMTYDLRGIGVNDLPDAVTIELLCSVNADTAPKTTH